jgi:hypothetical protein
MADWMHDMPPDQMGLFILHVPLHLHIRVRVNVSM